MITTAPLEGLLRLAEGIPETADNKLGRFELIRGLRNYLNALEKAEEGD